MNPFAPGVAEPDGQIVTIKDLDYTQGIVMRMGQVVATLSRGAEVLVDSGRARPAWYDIGLKTSRVYDAPASYTGVAEQFAELAGRWIDETAFESSLARIFTHQAYFEILALGRPIIPLLLARLGDEPERWVGALRVISREPIAESAESAESAVAAWREWGQAHGYYVA